ncbi:Ubiquitin carboxyl-terminal hydrolase family protein [Tritrichomonas foetus]|uniref:Ubiquitin carboxyl-terminal hydrolase n=1 Tax=Tritrichomonas foetus TaxID=1144522 RepID=A0A1J4KF44_9EUKA|nr:Ubiquitin carboxyl-terminal hydrolase family protein [Tritrichomonas foetus]|eukprot:OHT08214.1 Ubiquitin carboxyl-terminal hydrolase family protein [Tritrichomonas foetus]
MTSDPPPPSAPKTTLAHTEEEEFEEDSDSFYEEQLAFAGFSDSDDDENKDYITPSVLPDDAVKSCDQVVEFEIPSLAEISSENPIQGKDIQFDRFTLQTRFEINLAQEGAVYFSLNCEENFILDISLNIPSIHRVIYNRYCSFNKGSSVATLHPALFAPSEILDQPLQAYISIHKQPPENFSRQYFNCVGLVNSGMTCYLNSLIQCLFHIKLFRKTVYNCVNKSKIMNAMRTLFGRMQLSYIPVSTRDLTIAFGWKDQDYLFQQHDVQELLRILLSRLDDKCEGQASKIFKGKNLISIVTSTMTKSQEEEFNDLSLSVKDLHNLNESLSKFYETDYLSGDNQYTLDDNSKCDAEHQTKAIENPTILCLHLRRFEYVDGAIMKIYSRFEYEEELEFNGEKYELMSVVSHYGSVYGGHYNAFVKIDNVWTNFDDETVRHCEPYEALEDNFGDECRNKFTAYVLFYAKVGANDIKEPQVPQDIIDAEKERISHVKVLFYYGTHEEPFEIDLDKNMESKDYIEKLSQETGIPADKLVVKTIDENYGTTVVENPKPEPYPFLIDDSPLTAIWVKFWIPNYDVIYLGVFHINEGDTVEKLGSEILKKLELPEASLECLFILDEEMEGTPASGKIEQGCLLLFQYSEESATPDNFKAFEEAAKKITTLKPCKMPQYESHLTLLDDEISIKNHSDYYKYIKETDKLTFRSCTDPDNESKTFTLELSRHLTFEQVVKCLSKKLNADPTHVLLYLPDRFSQIHDPRPLSKDVYHLCFSITEITDIVYYEVFDEDMRFANKADITIITEKGELQSRNSIIMKRGPPQTLQVLAEKVVELINTTNFLMYYIVDAVPVFIPDDKNSDVSFDHRIFVQLYPSELEIQNYIKLRVIRCDDQFFLPAMSHGLPYVVFTEKGSNWNNIKEKFADEKIQLMRLLKRRVTPIDVTEDQEITEEDILAITYSRDYSCSLFSTSGAIEITKEDDEVFNEEEEFFEEEEEGIEE